MLPFQFQEPGTVRDTCQNESRTLPAKKSQPYYKDKGRINAFICFFIAHRTCCLIAGNVPEIDRIDSYILTAHYPR